MGTPYTKPADLRRIHTSYSGYQVVNNINGNQQLTRSIAGQVWTVTLTVLTGVVKIHGKQNLAHGDVLDVENV
jgi:hypothetical protein